jgi:hypothetical protein
VAQALAENRCLPPLPAPLQIELHPGTSCSVHCRHCTGLHLRRRADGEMPLRALTQIVSGMRQHAVERLTLSGIYTDPLSYSHLGALLECVRTHGVSLGLHSKFVTVAPDVLAELSRAHDDSYVHISIDYWENHEYQRQLQPDIPHAFEAVRANVQLLCAALAAVRSGMSVGIVSLLQANNTPADLEIASQFYRELRGHYPSVTINWRLSVPWAPTSRIRWLQRPGGRPLAPTAPVPAWVDERVRGVLATAERLPGRGRVTFRHNELVASPCPTCLNQLLYGAIGSCGGFYPCQGIASPEYNHLAYGNVRDGDDFFERWFNRDRAALGFRPGGGVCPACAAPTEREVNTFGAAHTAEGTTLGDAATSL